MRDIDTAAKNCYGAKALIDFWAWINDFPEQKVPKYDLSIELNRRIEDMHAKAK